MKANVFYVASLAMLSTAWLCAMPVLAAETETEASTAFPVTVVDAYDNEVTLDCSSDQHCFTGTDGYGDPVCDRSRGGHDRKDGLLQLSGGGDQSRFHRYLYGAEYGADFIQVPGSGCGIRFYR